MCRVCRLDRGLLMGGTSRWSGLSACPATVAVTVTATEFGAGSIRVIGTDADKLPREVIPAQQEEHPNARPEDSAHC